MATPPKLQLPNTLALRVQYLRNMLDLTRKQLATRAKVPVEQIEDIEAGLELFLSPSVRSKLARVLRVRPSQLREVERFLKADENEEAGLSDKVLMLKYTVKAQPHQQYQCPECQAPLVVRQFERRDLEDHPLRAVKIHCSQCLFRLDLED